MPRRPPPAWKEGLEGPPAYHSWIGMHARCKNPDLAGYENWGGRGIKVCERWNSYANFIADMGPPPGPDYSLDRYPDNDGNYEPSNCRWATAKQQIENRRPFGTWPWQIAHAAKWDKEVARARDELHRLYPRAFPKPEEIV